MTLCVTKSGRCNSKNINNLRLLNAKAIQTNIFIGMLRTTNLLNKVIQNNDLFVIMSFYCSINELFIVVITEVKSKRIEWSTDPDVWLKCFQETKSGKVILRMMGKKIQTRYSR